MSAAETPEAILDTPEAAPRFRHDGWTPERQRRFLECVAEGHTVENACRIVDLSVASAYALRRRAAGAGFALGWHAANLLARERVADTLLARALYGQTETGTRPDGGTWTRHRYDNGLATRLLARLDAQADAPASGPAHHAARIVAQEFDGFLDLLGRDAGPARAALFLANRAEQAADVEPVVALARADRFLQAGAGLASEIDVSDCDPARRAEWSADQWRRAEAAGLLRVAVPEAEGAPPPPEPQLPQLSPEPEPEADAAARAAEPVWWCDIQEQWRTRFPPPADFDGDCFGRYGDPDYERELDMEEREQLRLHEEEKFAADHAARDAWFGALLDGSGPPPPPRAAAPEPPPAEPPAPDPAVRARWDAAAWPMTLPVPGDDADPSGENGAAIAALDARAARDAPAARHAAAAPAPDDAPAAHDGRDEPARPPLVISGEQHHGIRA